MSDFNVNNQQQADVQNAFIETILDQTGFDPEVFQAEIVPLLQAAGNLLVNDAQGDDGEINTKELVPEIDPADVKDLATDMAQLEELIALLTLEKDEEQAKALQTRIETKIKDMETKHKETLTKIGEAVQKAVEQAKAAERNKIFGWIMTGLAVFGAIVSIVATAGTTSGVAIAACVLAVTSAAVGLTTQILQETGEMDKIIEHFAKQYAEEKGVTLQAAKQEMQKRAQIGMMVIQGVLALASLGCGVASLFSATKAATEIPKIVMLARYTQLGTQFLGLGGGIAQNVLQYMDLDLMKDAAEEEAQLAELKAFLEKLKAALEEDQSALQDLLQQIQEGYGVLIDILTKPLDTANDIMNNLKMEA